MESAPNPEVARGQLFRQAIIELVKSGKANDDDGISALCFNVAKEDRKADENGNEENVGRRGGQGTDEKDPCIDLESSQAGERNMRGTYSL